MRKAAVLSLMVLAACQEAQRAADPAANTIAAERSTASANGAEAAPASPAPKAETPAEAPDDYPGVAELSPSQRRAYERGYRDCRAGRYEPGEWAEAYRIGCAAAQEGR